MQSSWLSKALIIQKAAKIWSLMTQQRCNVLIFRSCQQSNKEISDVFDWISMLVTSFECLRSTIMYKDSGCWWPKWSTPSSTSSVVTNICHQHRCNRKLHRAAVYRIWPLKKFDMCPRLTKYPVVPSPRILYACGHDRPYPSDSVLAEKFSLPYLECLEPVHRFQENFQSVLCKLVT